MSTRATPGVRRNIVELQTEYDNGTNPQPLENLMRAWQGIKALDLTNPNSFFVLGGYHGEPFSGPGATNPNWWGGYCQHATVLFPTWHRAYLWKLEQALQSIPGCEDVMLPFWDECSNDSKTLGIPHVLTDETFVLDGETIPNPLRSFVLPQAINDQIPNDAPNYSKPLGYETVRYPLSGLVGSLGDREMTLAHNRLYPDYATNVQILDANIMAWLNGSVVIDNVSWGEIYAQFVACLDAPDYTSFSNTTSSPSTTPGSGVVPLESPHNYMHLAVGGFDYPGAGDISVIPNANGDMGENDTAGLDPIFFFHHCFIDYTFWVWQQRWGTTGGFTIDTTNAGAKYSPPGSLPPDGASPTDVLDVDTPLKPFPKPDGSWMSTSDVFNIESQLGYTYGPGSLDAYKDKSKAGVRSPAAAAAPGRTLHVSGIDRSKFKGSFLISAHARVEGKEQYLGTHAMLSRWHVAGCANCQNHLFAQASFGLPEGVPASLADGGIEVRLHSRHGVVRGPSRELGAGGVSTVAALHAEPPPFKVEIR